MAARNTSIMIHKNKPTHLFMKEPTPLKPPNPLSIFFPLLFDDLVKVEIPKIVIPAKTDHYFKMFWTALPKWL
jgi:hypothetical protein